MNQAQNKLSLQKTWLFDVLLILVLIAGAAFRFTGLDWGDYQYLHPDERFLLWVGSDISPVNRLGEYFDTAQSSLNPHNRGHGFYVYGTLPMFITRYVVEWVYGHSGFMEMSDVGRALSAAADLLVVFLVYLVAERLYNRFAALLAAAFSAAAVLQIQQSHFFTTDTFINLFTLLAFYFAVRVATIQTSRIEAVLAQSSPNKGLHSPEQEAQDPSELELPRRPLPARRSILGVFFTHPLFLPSLGFGIALGMGVASKLYAVPVSATLALALLIIFLRLPEELRGIYMRQALVFLAMAAFVSLLVFRIFQPYAFRGPGFFNILPNDLWVDNIKALQAQTSGDVDFPPAMQWARRPVWFSVQNMVLWGLGLPLGLLAWTGFLWAGWRTLLSWGKPGGEWQHHTLILGWTGAYFIWQSISPNPTLRYQLPIYPHLAVLAGWAISALITKGREMYQQPSAYRRKLVQGRLWQVLAFAVGSLVLVTTYAYAYAFTGIYQRPITRIEASHWIYENLPGPINVRIETGSEVFQQPVSFPYFDTIEPGLPYQTGFRPRESGSVQEIVFGHIESTFPSAETLPLTVEILDPNAQNAVAASGNVLIDLSEHSSYTVRLDQPVAVEQDTYYPIVLSTPDAPQEISLCGPTTLVITSGGDNIDQTIRSLPECTISPSNPAMASFQPQVSGLLSAVRVTAPTAYDGHSGAINITAAISRVGESTAASGNVTVQLPVPESDRDQGIEIFLDQVMPVTQDQTYVLTLEVNTSGTGLRLSGTALANEGDWDDPLPWRLDQYDPFGGIYPLDLNFNMYTDDNPEKLDRFLRILDEAEYVAITSSRQWGSLPRLPERFPMTTIYYRNLLGCPSEQSIEWCYNVAEPGMFEEQLGFELIKTFTSHPQIGPVTINDQFAEEAFTVYDHPKVFIFKKTGDFNPQKVVSILGNVDFEHVVRRPPMRMGDTPADLMLPEDRLAGLRAGGTWSELFDLQALQNRFPGLAVVLWYLSLTILGLFMYPILRLALPGLADRGYPVARVAGLLVFSYLAWLGGSLRVPVNQLTLTLVFLILAITGSWLAFQQRQAIGNELRTGWRYFLSIEGLFLLFFLVDLLIRIGNPDLWHPYKGGEKPMDFAYFNAVMRSETFPPYDPWYSGGYLNYYYYGFVFVGMLTKWLGIEPAIAYNLILPTLYAMIALGAFSVVWNLIQRIQRQELRKDLTLADFQERNSGDPGEEPEPDLSGPSWRDFAWKPFGIALSAAVAMSTLGNLGTIRMIWRGYQMLGAPDSTILESAGFLTRLVWAFRGFFATLSGASLRYPVDQWYWNPSRVIAPQGDVEPITEFPFFTVLYADPHAHLYAIPIALFALAFIVSIVRSRMRWSSPGAAALGFALGGLALGALRPTNTWDFYPYLALASVAVIYTLLSYYEPSDWLFHRLPFLTHLPLSVFRLLAALAGTVLLVSLAHLLFQPYAAWYGLGYGEIQRWTGPTTPSGDYLVHWGLFLFLIVSWMFWETVDWMANTPVSALRRLQPIKGAILAIPVLLLGGVLVLILLKVWIGWIALPLAAWAGILILRPTQPEAKRLVLFLIGTGLVMTLMVEVIVLKGDIGRMNTVFKFYLQVWAFFSISAAAGLGWMLTALQRWNSGWRAAWQIALAALFTSALLYPLTGSLAKIQDRMIDEAPHTLNGMTYMKYAEYEWKGLMDLSQDFAAIRWMQENVVGSPVIVEAASPDIYRWYNRFSIYTGLPAVVGWEWHQMQQRAINPSSWVSSRVQAVRSFYETTDIEAAVRFINQYNVRYIVVGQLERNVYGGPGLEKFPAMEGQLWREVFHQGETTIYEVILPAPTAQH